MISPVRFGKYTLLDKIAVGGMAELYRAKITGEKGFEKLIAIKKLLPHLNSDHSLVAHFIDEAKLAAFLQHQNIIQIYDFGNTEEIYFIAMEYLFGKDLRAIAYKAQETEAPIGVENALYIATRVCDGLEYAHTLKDFQGNPFNIIHRDVSPQNIFITYDGQVKLIDFGIAKAASQSSMTQTGIIKGKVAYMSPEQASGEKFDHRSDIFATGIILYEMITGHRMFEGDTMEILSKVRKAQFEPPEKFVKRQHPKVYEIIYRSLEKDPDRRYQTAGDMLADLEECIRRITYRPSARTLSKYMYELFRDDIEPEEKAMREAALTDVSAPKAEPDAAAAESSPEIAKPPEEEEDFDKTVILPRKTDTPKSSAAPTAKKRIIRYAAAALTLTLILLLSMLLLKSGSTPSSSKRIPIQPIQKAVERAVPQEQVPEGGSSTEVMEPPAPKHDDSQAAKLPATIEPVGAEPRAQESQPLKIPTRVQDEDKDGASRINAARQALAEERFSEAVEDFKTFLSAHPDQKAKIAVDYAEALQNLADQVGEKDAPRAEKLLRQALELSPGNAQAHYKLGLLYSDQEKYDKAASAYQNVIQRDDTFVNAFFNLGYIYTKTGQYEKAEAMYTKVVALHPAYVDEALVNLAYTQNKLGKRAAAVQNLEQALKLNPENKVAAKVLQRFQNTDGG